MDLCVSLRHGEFLHSPHILPARQDAPSLDVMCQVHDFRLEEQALQRLKLQIKLLVPLKHHTHVLQVLLICATKDYDVIQVDHTICEVQLPQGVLHETLECHGCIAQPEWHVGKLVESKVTHCESCVLLQTWGHLNLPEAQLEIH